MARMQGLSHHGRELAFEGYGLGRAELDALPPGPTDLRTWFNVDRDADASQTARPLELEIGSGKGTFLVQEAAVRPETLFVGLEYARAFWRHAADRMRRRAIANVRMVHAEAGVFVRDRVPIGALDVVHIYFPDPWPKKRHHKRRLIQEPFLRLLHGRLVPRGEVRLATDHADYFDWMQDHAGRVADVFERLPFTPPASAQEGELVGTNFERKYRKEGRTFNGMTLKRRT